jgi:ubiquinone/menaquinone biosynthesis C-methylase UbiE
LTELEQNTVTKYYSRISNEYERIRLFNNKNKIVSALQISWLIKNLGRKNSILLEVGCGTGRITRSIINEADFLIAADGSLEMIKINRSAMKMPEKDKVSYVLCHASYLPFVSECFSGVLGARVFWHIQDYCLALKDSYRVLIANNPLLFDFPCLFGPFAAQFKFRLVNQEVLTEFISRKEIETLFQHSTHLSVVGNTSSAISLIPDNLLKIGVIYRLVLQLEMCKSFPIIDIFYSYFLVKVIK